MIERCRNVLFGNCNSLNYFNAVDTMTVSMTEMI